MSPRLDLGCPSAQTKVLVRYTKRSVKTSAISGIQTYPFQAPVQAPVALPGFTKNRPSYSIAWNLRPIPQQTNAQVKHRTHVCVLPLTSTSTSICLAIALKLSKSPVGIHWCPWTTPMRIGVWVTVALKGKLDVYTANQHPSISSSSTHLLRHSPPARQLHRQLRS